MQLDRNRQFGPGRACDARSRGWRGLAGAALALAAFGIVASGCGSQEQRSASVGAGEAGVVTVPAYETSGEANTVHAVVSGATEIGPAAQPGDGTMPPDIIVTASNTIVAPGEVIDIVVQATPDVTEMSLWDGLNDRQALAYDSDAKAWRVSYRVPLKLPWERTGLAITAKNDGQRWCRSWVFIQMASAAPLADTAGVETQPLAEEVAETGER
jgi:hypothetical protein